MIDFLKKIAFARFRSLRISMLCALLVGIILAGSVFAGAHFISNAYIKNDYLSAESRDAREAEYYRGLQRFVDRYALESSDTDMLAEWVRNNRYLYVMIYKDDQLFFDSGSYEPSPEPAPTPTPTPDEGGEPDDGTTDPENPDAPGGTDPEGGEGEATPEGREGAGDDVEAYRKRALIRAHGTDSNQKEGNHA